MRELMRLRVLSNSRGLDRYHAEVAQSIGLRVLSNSRGLDRVILTEAPRYCLRVLSNSRGLDLRASRDRGEALFESVVKLERSRSSVVQIENHLGLRVLSNSRGLD